MSFKFSSLYAFNLLQYKALARSPQARQPSTEHFILFLREYKINTYLIDSSETNYPIPTPSRLICLLVMWPAVASCPGACGAGLVVLVCLVVGCFGCLFLGVVGSGSGWVC